MKNEFLTQHFRKSGFDEMQADALTAYFSQLQDEMATKQDVAFLRTEMKADIAILRNEMATGLDALRREMTTSQGALRNEVAASLNGLRTDMATLKGDLTWRFVALVVFLSTVTTLLSIFVQ